MKKSAFGNNLRSPASRYLTQTPETIKIPETMETKVNTETPEPTQTQETPQILENPKTPVFTERTKQASSLKTTQTPLLAKKENVTVSLPKDLLQQVKAVVYYTPGLTLSGAVEQALQAWLKKQPPQEQPAGRLKVGRPMLR